MRWGALAGILVAGAATPAHAELNGDDVLLLVDKAGNKADDQVLEYDCNTQEAGQADRSLSFRVYLKGDKWRRVDFLAPGDLKGMRVLVRSSDTTYVYLPAYRRVRRLASHVKGQGFMGTAFSDDEMSLLSFGDLYNGRLVGENPKAWTVEANLKPNEDFPYAKLELDVRKDLKQPVEIRYFNDKGLHVKTETRSKFTCAKSVCTPETIKMIDHTRNDLTSILKRTKWKPNSGIPDSFFTVKALQRGA